MHPLSVDRSMLSELEIDGHLEGAIHGQAITSPSQTTNA